MCFSVLLYLSPWYVQGITGFSVNICHLICAHKIFCCCVSKAFAVPLKKFFSRQCKKIMHSCMTQVWGVSPMHFLNTSNMSMTFMYLKRFYYNLRDDDDLNQSNTYKELSMTLKHDIVSIYLVVSKCWRHRRPHNAPPCFAYNDTRSRRHKYSFPSSLAIFQQYPDIVSGTQTWFQRSHTLYTTGQQSERTTYHDNNRKGNINVYGNWRAVKSGIIH